MPTTRLSSSTTAGCSGRAAHRRASRSAPAASSTSRGPPPAAAKGFGTAPAAPPPKAAPTVAPPPVDGEEQANMRVSMVSLGCPKNTVDGEVLLGDFAAHGFSVIDDHTQADAIVVNTCAFVEDAKTESLDAILEAAALKAGPGSDGRARKVVVTGCLAQRYAGELAASLPEADLVVGFEGYAGLPAALREALGGASAASKAGPAAPPARVRVGSPTVPFRGEAVRHRLTPRHTAYLRVAEGCSHKCTFCAIPGFRGTFRSKPWDALLAEARALVEAGALELCLIAEDTNQYGSDLGDGSSLASLLRELSATLPSLRWIRLLYCYPSYFDEALIAEIASNPKVCKYVDMPLQHVHNLTLLAMARPPRAHADALLARLRAGIPDLALRTTFISGFPGETEAAHRELVDFCDAFKFERMGAFAYSEEDGTPAARLPGQVHPDTRAARRDELVALQQAIGGAFAEGLVGRELDVLVDGYDEDGALIGRTQWDAPDVDPIVFLGEPEAGSGVAPAEPGQMRRCVVVGASLFDLEATPVV